MKRGQSVYGISHSEGSAGNNEEKVVAFFQTFARGIFPFLSDA